MEPPAIPIATYRLQFNQDFTFADASRIIAYLHQLGISHVYASPLLKARAGSPHGYDIVDHNALNAEIGDEKAFTAYIETLRRYGMGQIIDIVANHMGVGGDDNEWWLDVLENGEASVYAPYFDIDWHPANPALQNKVLLPFLGNHYGSILEQGELKLVFEPAQGRFSVRYYEHLFPIDPRTYPQVLALRMDRLEQIVQQQNGVFSEYTSLITECRSLPRRTEVSTLHRQQRREAGIVCKQQLAGLCRKQPEIEHFLAENVTQFNGTPGDTKSFDLLHQLLEAQAYRLAYWQVASDEINYRRFFDINSLAGLRMDNHKVFEATHRLIETQIRKGQIHGLRIDHPDGLSDPFSYYWDLKQMITSARASQPGRQNGDTFYTVVEKILSRYERLPVDWPVSGTTGYELAYLLNGLFIYPGSERQFDRLYMRFTGRRLIFDDLLYERKKLIIRSALSSELTVLANLLNSIAQTDRHTRDFTHQSLREALGEVVACFPVYRTYITEERINEEDHRYIQWAVAQAKRRNPATDRLIFDFIHDLLVLARLERASSNIRRKMIQLALRFQQYTAPVMAKGMEDTSFYVYNRLVSLNDVGFDPRIFAISSTAFHHENRQRLSDWPHNMVNTSTHDSKRSEDVRVRINVLTEVADEWIQHLGRWSRINRKKKRVLNEQRMPSRNDEYLLYQTLVGTWPLQPLDASGLAEFRQRISDYMLKAIKEAKMDTSWINPNEEYEEAMRHFVATLLDNPEQNAFLADFMPFQRRIARFGLLNSLSQTLLKLTIPGVPDIYQGTELWSFSLVDPDNRRPVDYQQRETGLQRLLEYSRTDNGAAGLLKRLLHQLEDGQAKLYVIYKTLHLRRDYAQLFNQGDYHGLAVHGPGAEHICAFVRSLEDRKLIVIASRWFARLLTDETQLPIGESVWGDTMIEAPASHGEEAYREVLSEVPVPLFEYDGMLYFEAAVVMAHFPVALLINDQKSGSSSST